MKVLTINEVAKILGINLHTAYKYAREGKIPSIRIGRSWRVVQETLEVWVKEKMGKDLGAWHKKTTEVKGHFKEVIGVFERGPILSSPEDIDKELYGEMKTSLNPEDDPIRKVMGIFKDGPILSSPEDIDEELYGDKRIE